MIRLKNCSFNALIYVPDGGGSTTNFVREPQYTIGLDAGTVIIRSASVKNGATTKVPMSNVSSYQEAPPEPKEDTKPSVAKA
jgi:hypothetical protein